MIYRFLSIFSAQPLYWSMALLAVAAFIKNKKHKRFCIVTSVILLLFFSIQPPYRVAESLWIKEYNKPLAPGVTYPYGIVLGGFALYNGANNQPEFNENADRWIHGVKLYHQGVIKKIVLASDGSIVENGAGNPESMIRFLSAFQVKPEDIILETKAETTQENAVFTAALIDTTQRSLLITSAVHMRRSIAVFTNAGVKVDPYCTDFELTPIRSQDKMEAWIPKIGNFKRWEMLFHEIVGMMVYKIRGFF